MLNKEEEIDKITDEIEDQKIRLNEVIEEISDIEKQIANINLNIHFVFLLIYRLTLNY